jgi:hypothetical protein
MTSVGDEHRGSGISWAWLVACAVILYLLYAL